MRPRREQRATTPDETALEEARAKAEKMRALLERAHRARDEAERSRRHRPKPVVVRTAAQAKARARRRVRSKIRRKTLQAQRRR